MPKTLIKQSVRSIAIIAISPLLITHVLLSLVAGKDPSLESHSQILSLVPGTVGSYLRVAFYRFALQRCDPTATICFGALLSKANAEIHENVYIGPRTMLGCVTLERDVLLGPAVQIPSGPHTHGTDRVDVPIRLQSGKMCRVTIGFDSWIGAGALVLADVSPQCVVGAGSIVTKPTAPKSILVGNPAREVAKRQDGAKVTTPLEDTVPVTQVDEVRANSAT